MRSGAALKQRHLDAIGKRIQSCGDQNIEIAHLTLARLCITAETPFGFGDRMLDIRPDRPKRYVDAAALNALLLLAESKLPKGPAQPVLHTFQPHRSGYFCKVCGYGPLEPLKHIQGEAA